MSLFNSNVNIKIRDVGLMEWCSSSVLVAPRPYHALALRLEGNAVFSHNTNIISTEANDVIYMPANYAYHANYSNYNKIFVIHFESDMNSEMNNFKSDICFIPLFEKAYHIWNERKEGYYYKTMSLLCEVLSVLSIENDYFDNHGTKKHFQVAVEYMKNNYTQCDLSIEKLISMAYMSGTYFRKIFYIKFGTTPIKYLNRLRLNYAEKLLSTGKYSINDVATFSGFSDVKYFSRIVKKEYGIPPSKLYQHIYTNE